MVLLVWAIITVDCSMSFSSRNGVVLTHSVDLDSIAGPLFFCVCVTSVAD